MSSKQATQQLRVIGGQWRSRRLRFPELNGLRPTLDRVRETLFNWIQHDIVGARAVDVFAGSGALGIEALSRGAREVIFLEKHPKAALALKDNMAQLDTANAQVWACDALQWLERNPEPFDVVFLDPPFGQQLLPKAIEQLRLLPGAVVYVEHEAGLACEFPHNWQERRHKTTKEFTFRLFDVVESGDT